MNTHRRIQTVALAMAAFSGTVAATAGRAQGDRPLQVTQLFETEFPAALTMQGITEGRVRAVVKVDPPARLADCLVVGSTHPELARHLLQNLDAWRFEAPYQGGEAVSARATVEFSYSARGIVLSVSAADTFTLALNRWFEPEVASLVCRADQLDRPLVPVQTVRPRHPGFPPPGGKSGVASVDFYVDGDGRPRLAVVANCSHDAYGAAAVEALQRWRFAPPTRAGKPVVVRVQQNFVFAGHD